MKIHRYEVIKEDGKTVSIWTKGPAPLETLQLLVGGPIEIVPPSMLQEGDLVDGEVMLCNEEGSFTEHLRNNERYPALIGNLVICRSRNQNFEGIEIREAEGG